MEHRLRFSPGVCIFAAFLLVSIPFRWAAGVILAAAIHELSHLMAVRLTGGKITGISIGITGAKIETLPMSRGREVLCAAAGPLGSLLLASVLPGFPEAAVSGLIQGIYNLLPVYPLDGGRILRAVLPDSVCNGIRISTLILLVGLGFWCMVSLEGGFVALFPACIAGISSFHRKFPCKEGNLAVQ